MRKIYLVIALVALSACAGPETITNACACCKEMKECCCKDKKATHGKQCPPKEKI